MQVNRDQTLYVTGTGYLDDNVTYNNMGSIIDKRNLTITTEDTFKKRMSFIGRINYDYMSKYYITIIGRYDGASMFAANKKWGFFPSAAARWNIINEKWMMGAKTTWLSNLALRASFGLSGNDALGAYQSIQALSVNQRAWLFGNKLEPAFSPNRVGNENLSWETTRTTDIGLDMSFLHNRIDLSLDLYWAYTSDLLLSVKNSATTGFTSRMANVGDTSNRGVELSITSRNITTAKFGWSTTLTISHNSSRVENLGNGFDKIATYSYSGHMLYGFKKGYPVNALWGYQYAGVWHNQGEIDENKITHAYGTYQNVPGYAKYIDVNHDGVLNDDDSIYMGTGDPLVSGGFQNDFNIGRFTLGIYFTYSLGGKLYNMSEFMLGSSNATTNKFRYMADAWHPVKNPDSNLPSAYSYDGYGSDRFIHDASFLRLKTLSLSYRYDFRKTKFLKYMKFVLACDNLFLISSYNGFDPDVTSGSIRRIDNGAYPPIRTVSFSIQLHN